MFAWMFICNFTTNLRSFANGVNTFWSSAPFIKYWKPFPPTILLFSFYYFDIYCVRGSRLEIVAILNWDRKLHWNRPDYFRQFKISFCVKRGGGHWKFTDIKIFYYIKLTQNFSFENSSVIFFLQLNIFL